MWVINSGSDKKTAYSNILVLRIGKKIYLENVTSSFEVLVHGWLVACISLGSFSEEQNNSQYGS